MQAIVRTDKVGAVTVFGPIGIEDAVERLDRIAARVKGKNVWLDDAVEGLRFEVHDLLAPDYGVRFTGAGVKP